MQTGRPYKIARELPMPDISLVDLRLQYSLLRDEIDGAMKRVMESADFILGHDVKEFEREFGEFLGINNCVGVASGTDALLMVLKALNIGPGDEVIVPAHTFVATAFAVSLVGARPIFADVKNDDYTIDPQQVETLISPRTKAVMPVHMYGHVADMDPLRETASRNGISVVEDACQAHGARYRGRRAGTFGIASAFSFYPGKNLGAFGDGGLVASNEPEIAKSVKLLRNYGQIEKYHHELIGQNSRLDTLQAAVLRVKLRRLENWNQQRRQIADLYREALSDVPVVLPRCLPTVEHVYHLFVIRSPQRSALLSHLHSQGIGAGVHYPVPLHLQKPYENLGYRAGQFPVSEKICSEVLSLPMYPEMTENQVGAVAEAVKNFFTKGS
jgi:dTDP-4-amino-4,6-dideoxygalactose transaminase